MTSLAWVQIDSPVTRLDPRVRLVAGFVISIMLAVVQHGEAAVMGLLTAMVCCWLARISWRGLWPRWVALNGLLLVLVGLLPWSVPGAALWVVGPWAYSWEGLQLAVVVTLKSNAILLVCAALISTINTASLAHALSHLHLPARLIQLLLFTIRYLELLQRERVRLWRAARARGFDARMNRHTYRTIAQLVGMLILRSLDRADRVLNAMRARGYRGRFYLLHHFAFRRTDLAGTIILMLWVALLAWWEWL